MGVCPFVIIPREYGDQVAVNHARKCKVNNGCGGCADNIRGYDLLLGYFKYPFPSGLLYGLAEMIIYFVNTCFPLCEDRKHRKGSYRNWYANRKAIKNSIQRW